MSATLRGLQELVAICTRISNKNCINFNSSKTELCISRGARTTNSYILVNGHVIKPKDNLKHLGFLWNNKNNLLTIEDANIKCGIGKFWSVIETLSSSLALDSVTLIR